MDMARMPDGRTLRHCPDVMDITEMCRVLNISTKTGYRLLKNGDISSLKIGRAYRIPKPISWRISRSEKWAGCGSPSITLPRACAGAYAWSVNGRNPGCKKEGQP